MNDFATFDMLPFIPRRRTKIANIITHRLNVNVMVLMFARTLVLQFSTLAGSSPSHLTPASDLRASVFGRSGLAEHGSILFFLKCCHLCVMDFRFWMPFLNNGPRGTIYSVQVKNKPENKNNEFAFSALTLLVGRQEEHLAYKN